MDQAARKQVEEQLQKKKDSVRRAGEEVRRIFVDPAEEAMSRNHNLSPPIVPNPNRSGG